MKLLNAQICCSNNINHSAWLVLILRVSECSGHEVKCLADEVSTAAWKAYNTLTLWAPRAVHNSAQGSGGGLAVIASQNTSSKLNKFYQNSASYGGAVALSPCLLHMDFENSEVKDNHEVSHAAHECAATLGCCMKGEQDDL